MVAPARVLVVDDSPTILKVVTAILARHGFETAAARDGAVALELLRRGPPFDLVLLDFVMPRMNGFQLCREIRVLPTLQDLPIVLMSAKGDRIRGQFLQQTGAADAITKPFDATTLVGVVRGALALGSAPPARLSSRTRPTQGVDSSRGDVPAAAVDRLVTSVASAVASLPETERAQEPALRAAVKASLTPEVLRALRPAPAGLDAHAREVMVGDLAAIPLAEILQVLHLQRQTGVLRVASPRSTVTVSLCEGEVDLARGDGQAPEYRIGRYFIDKGLISRAEIDDIARTAGAELLGRRLVALGRITPDDLVEALTAQSSELVYDVLRWPYGRFAFSKGPLPPEAEDAHLGLGVSGMVLEAFRRVDEWRRLQGSLDLDEVLLLDDGGLDEVGPQTLSSAGQRIVAATDGVRTVNEVITESAVSSFDGVKLVCELLQARVLRRRPSAPPRRAHLV
jgi:CheY-like chemotaxis protein